MLTFLSPLFSNTSLRLAFITMPESRQCLACEKQADKQCQSCGVLFCSAECQKLVSALVWSRRVAGADSLFTQLFPIHKSLCKVDDSTFQVPPITQATRALLLRTRDDVYVDRFTELANLPRKTLVEYVQSLGFFRTDGTFDVRGFFSAPSAA